MRVELPNGHWADIRGVDELRARDRKAVNKAIQMRVDADTQTPIISGSMDDDMTDALLARVITSWDLMMPIPMEDPESLDKLELPVYDALAEAVSEHMKVVRGDSPTRPGTLPTNASAS